MSKSQWSTLKVALAIILCAVFGTSGWATLITVVLFLTAMEFHEWLYVKLFGEKNL